MLCLPRVSLTELHAKELFEVSEVCENSDVVVVAKVTVVRRGVVG